MKAKAGKCIVAATLACVSLGSALCLTVGSHSALAEDAAGDYNLSVCEQRLTTIGEDIPSLVAGYNEVYETDWTASEIEYSAPVFIVEDNEYGMYLDFDGDNGYAVITTDKKIYGIETSGDLEYIRDDSAIYYSYIDGFLYIDDDGQYQKYELEEELSEEDIADGGNTVSLMSNSWDASKHPGQPEAGDDGKIDPSLLDEYVAECYPGFGRTLKLDSMVASFECSNQYNVSYYVMKFDDVSLSPLSEGNCMLNAMFNVMRDWAKRGYIKNVNYAQTIDMRSIIQYDSLYSAYGTGTKTDTYKEDGKYKNKSYKWISNDGYNQSYSCLAKMPVLYTNIRDYAVKRGYKPQGGYADEKTPETMQYVAKYHYNNDLQVVHTAVASTVAAEIMNNRSCVLAISGSSSYKNHGVAVIGVHRYSKYTVLNQGYVQEELKYFYEIADGGYIVSRIFDPNTPYAPELDFYYFKSNVELPRC